MHDSYHLLGPKPEINHNKICFKNDDIEPMHCNVAHFALLSAKENARQGLTQGAISSNVTTIKKLDDLLRGGFNSPSLVSAIGITLHWIPATRNDLGQGGSLSSAPKKI